MVSRFIKKMLVSLPGWLPFSSCLSTFKNVLLNHCRFLGKYGRSPAKTSTLIGSCQELHIEVDGVFLATFVNLHSRELS